MEVDLKEEQVNYELDLSQIAPAGRGLIDATRYEDAEHIASFKQDLTTLRAMVNYHESAAEQLLEGFSDRVRALKIADSLKESSIKQFEDEKQRRLRALHADADLERKICDEMDGLMGFLESRPGKFQFQGADLVFDAAPDNDDYARRIQRVRELDRQKLVLAEQVATEADTGASKTSQEIKNGEK